MLPSEQILENAAQDGSIDIAEWPRVLETLLKRLHDIVHTEFPLPSIPLPTPLDPEVIASTPPARGNSHLGPKDEELPDADDDNDENAGPLPSSQNSTKENDLPTDIAASRPSIPGFEGSHIPQQLIQPPDIVATQPGMLPPDLLSLYTTTTRILEHDFAHSPPYTIQRLAEMVLYPKKHYRFLPAYLRALDRIVSVSSPVSDFPLPSLHSTSHGGFLTNGDANHSNGFSERDGLGSDESLGGALLTPIPWLRHNALGGNTNNNTQSTNSQSESEFRSESTETILGPNGAGSIETVSVTVNGVPSATSIAHTSPVHAGPTSPTLSEQSDASSTSTSSGPTTEAELRDQGGVTQGELLRQEQEAGVIPLTQASPRRSLLAAGAVAVGREAPVHGRAIAAAAHIGAAESIEDDGPPEEIPHARGPEEIGMEDMGPQHASLDGGLDMEAAVGRGRSKSPQPPVLPVEAMPDMDDDAGAAGRDPRDVEMELEKLKEVMDAEKKDEEGDVVVADADGVEVDKRDEMEVGGDLGGVDAVDQTTL